jgi:mannitol/fructose-specific phosphotransferase system IIA component (Ntr-type)
MIYNVSVAFNVEAESQNEAFKKLADYLEKNAPNISYEEIEEPVLLKSCDVRDYETVIQ